MGVGSDFSGEMSTEKAHKLAIETGIDLGMNLLDTAEVYGQGLSEQLIGKVISRKRDKIIIATKFSPENSSFQGVIRSAEASLRRLRTDYIDIYQLHWPNPTIPISETMAALETLVLQGKVRFIGVSNMSLRETLEACTCLNSNVLISNQLEYNLFDRSIENEMLKYCLESDLALFAYSPLDKGRIVNGAKELKILKSIGQKYDKSASQVALNWLVRNRSVIAIPKSTNIAHIKNNSEAMNFEMDLADYRLIGETCSVSPDLILPRTITVSPAGEDNRSVYQNLEEAIGNKLNLSPSPEQLALSLKLNDPIKPVRLHLRDNPGDFKYDLIEGRLRYWAWVIAFGWETPIPAYIR
jgi:diketogulonate reductase-like aldo/keto reductase